MLAFPIREDGWPKALQTGTFCTRPMCIKFPDSPRKKRAGKRFIFVQTLRNESGSSFV